MEKIKFPVANISHPHWDKNDDYLLYILFDQYLYTAKETLYRQYFLDNSFVDSNGNVFKITGRILPSRIRQVLSFIPGFCRVELVFQATGATMDIEDVRHHMVRQLEKLDSNEQNTAWIDNVKNAKTISDVIYGDSEPE